MGSVLKPKRSDVKYVVSWQQQGASKIEEKALPESLTRRKDVKIVVSKERGLAKNRNTALKFATGDILLLADDDVEYEEGAFDLIKTCFDSSDSDILCFQAADREGNLLHNYSPYPFTYDKKPRGTYFSSIEIAMRRLPTLPRFDERFGIGSPLLGAGEEEVFLFEAHKAGLKISYLPLQIVRTNPDTTGTHYLSSPALWRTKGAVLYVMHGVLGAALRSAKDAFTRRGLRDRMAVLNEMFKGIRYIRTTQKP